MLTAVDVYAAAVWYLIEFKRVERCCICVTIRGGVIDLDGWILTFFTINAVCCTCAGLKAT